MTLRRAFRGTVQITSVATALATLVACGATESADGEGLTPLTFRGPFVTTGGDAPFYYARALGFYEEVGIDLEIVDSRNSVQTVQDVAEGGVEFGEADASSIMLGVAGGREVVAVSSTVGKSSFGFYVPTDAGVTEPSELVGASVAAIPTVEASMNAALSAAGLSPEDISPVFADSNALITTYLGGDVDALYTTALLRGAVARRPSEILLQAEFGYNPPDYALIVTPEFLESDPELVRGFVSATLRGFQAAREDPEAAIDVLLEDHPELDRDQAMGVLLAVSEFLCAESQAGQPYGWNAEEDWTAAAGALQQWAGLTGETDGFRFITNQFFEGESSIDAGTC